MCANACEYDTVRRWWPKYTRAMLHSIHYRRERFERWLLLSKRVLLFRIPISDLIQFDVASRLTHVAFCTRPRHINHRLVMISVVADRRAEWVPVRTGPVDMNKWIKLAQTWHLPLNNCAIKMAHTQCSWLFTSMDRTIGHWFARSFNSFSKRNWFICVILCIGPLHFWV